MVINRVFNIVPVFFVRCGVCACFHGVFCVVFGLWCGFIPVLVLLYAFFVL